MLPIWQKQRIVFISFVLLLSGSAHATANDVVNGSNEAVQDQSKGSETESRPVDPAVRVKRSVFLIAAEPEPIKRTMPYFREILDQASTAKRLMPYIGEALDTTGLAKRTAPYFRGILGSQGSVDKRSMPYFREIVSSLSGEEDPSFGEPGYYGAGFRKRDGNLLYRANPVGGVRKRMGLPYFKEISSKVRNGDYSLIKRSIMPYLREIVQDADLVQK